MIDLVSLKGVKHQLEMLQLELELHIKRCPLRAGECAQQVVYSRVANIMIVLNNAVENRHHRRRKEDNHGTD